MDSVLWSILRLSFVKWSSIRLTPHFFCKGLLFYFLLWFLFTCATRLPSQKTFISSDSNTTGFTSRALPAYINGAPSSSRVLVGQDIVFYVVLYLPFFWCISVIVWPLCCLSFTLRLLITIFWYIQAFPLLLLNFTLKSTTEED